MRALSGFVLAGVLAGLAGGASAQTLGQSDGWYIGAGVGENILPKQALKTRDAAGGRFEESNYLGPIINGSVGYGLGQMGIGSLRVEEQLGWAHNPVAHLDNLGGANGTARGSITNWTLMTNALYDIPTGISFLPILTVGAGIGAVNVGANSVRSLNGLAVSNDSDWVGAAQAIVGERIPLNQNLSLNVQGDAMQTTRAKWQDAAALGGHSSTFNEHSYAITMGFIYQFGTPKPTPVAAVSAPPPPPPPKAAPAPAPAPTAVIPHDYQVFFDFDKSDLSTESLKTLQMASDNAKKLNSTRINLTGHTDRAGTEQYNMALSLRRANAVKAQLVKMGVPANEISVTGKGEDDPLVPTADGVREPKNRRVEIVLP